MLDIAVWRDGEGGRRGEDVRPRERMSTEIEVVTESDRVFKDSGRQIERNPERKRDYLWERSCSLQLAVMGKRVDKEVTLCRKRG